MRIIKRKNKIKRVHAYSQKETIDKLNRLTRKSRQIINSIICGGLPFRQF